MKRFVLSSHKARVPLLSRPSRVWGQHTTQVWAVVWGVFCRCHRSVCFWGGGE